MFLKLVKILCSIKLSLLGKSLIGEIDGYTRLRELLKENIFADFEFIIIGTPAALGNFYQRGD